MDNGEEFRDSPVSGKHYEWQLTVGHQRLHIENDHVIETHYCQPGAKGITIKTSYGQVFIDFDKFEALTTGLSQPVTVQRLSLLPEGQTEDIGWYFRDDRLWREYGSQSSGTTSSVTSHDVERHFTVNPQGSFSFTVGSTGYKLDFPSMRQMNCHTGMQRNVRRRPKLPSNAESLYSTINVPTASSSQLTDGGYKWEFMGDEGQWTEYQADVCSLGSDDIERQYRLNPLGQLSFRIRSYSYTLDFSRMHQVNNNFGTQRTVRRTARCGSQQSSSLSPQPRWQFQDITGRWKDYSKSNSQCSVSSHDIELNYQQDPSGSMIFTTKHYRYELDFSAMTQKNLSTSTVRVVQRLDQ